MEFNELRDAGIEYLMKTPAGDTLNKAFLEFEKCQTALCALIDNEDGSRTQTLRVGTVFILAVVNK